MQTEKGMSTTNLARWAKHQVYRLRGRGRPSHTANSNAATAADNAPALLRPALAQIGGPERLSRFAAVSGYLPVTAAASALGLHQPVLHGQIARLETELCSPLLARAEGGHPMTLTDLGTQLLQAWNGWTARSAGEKHSM